MKHFFLWATGLLLPASTVFAQKNEPYISPGTFSLGTRVTTSMFNDDDAAGMGIGGQFRIQLGKRLGSEWFLDYISSKNGELTYRNDYHFGWSLMYYFSKDAEKVAFFQPYFLAGHCFDYTKVYEQANAANYADRWSMAAQAGIGSHLNLTNRFDCSLSAQYMLHFGKDIKVSGDKEAVLIEKQNHSSPDGHLLITLSFNYKLFHLWR